jgi:hypothetical protein
VRGARFTVTGWCAAMHRKPISPATARG